MIAAYEQKDVAEFDAEEADARAMQLFNSRAFRAYMNGHPDTLAAAAKNQGVKDTHDSIVALDADLKRRDAVLSDAKDTMKQLATGKTSSFYPMLNALTRFVEADTEPSKQEKQNLLNAIGTYLTTNCAPDSKEADKTCLFQALRVVKVLVPEKEFKGILESVNHERDPKIRAEDISLEIPAKQVARKEPERILAKNNP